MSQVWKKSLDLDFFVFSQALSLGQMSPVCTRLKSAWKLTQQINSFLIYQLLHDKFLCCTIFFFFFDPILPFNCIAVKSHPARNHLAPLSRRHAPMWIFCLTLTTSVWLELPVWSHRHWAGSCLLSRQTVVPLLHLALFLRWENISATFEHLVACFYFSRSHWFFEKKKREKKTWKIITNNEKTVISSRIVVLGHFTMKPMIS